MNIEIVKHTDKELIAHVTLKSGRRAKIEHIPGVMTRAWTIGEKNVSGDEKYLGWIDWDRNVVKLIKVIDGRRDGLATAMWRVARMFDPDLYLGNEFTLPGKDWVRSLGPDDGVPDGLVDSWNQGIGEYMLGRGEPVEKVRDHLKKTFDYDFQIEKTSSVAPSGPWYHWSYSGQLHTPWIHAGTEAAALDRKETLEDDVRDYGRDPVMYELALSGPFLNTPETPIADVMIMEGLQWQSEEPRVPWPGSSPELMLERWEEEWGENWRDCAPDHVANSLPVVEALLAGKRGAIFYVNEGEDPGSISVLAPKEQWRVVKQTKTSSATRLYRGIRLMVPLDDLVAKGAEAAIDALLSEQEYRRGHVGVHWSRSPQEARGFALGAGGSVDIYGGPRHGSGAYSLSVPVVLIGRPSIGSVQDPDAAQDIGMAMDLQDEDEYPMRGGADVALDAIEVLLPHEEWLAALKREVGYVSTTDAWERRSAWTEVSAPLRVRASRNHPLVLEEGLFYRMHPRGRNFGVEDASSAVLGWDELPEGDVKRITRPRAGYSAFSNPEHLRQYLDEMGWSDSGDPIVVFRGSVVGEGYDGEPLVMPEGKIIERMSWSVFLDRLEITEGALSYPRWNEVGGVPWPTLASRTAADSITLYRGVHLDLDFDEARSLVDGDVSVLTEYVRSGQQNRWWSPSLREARMYAGTFVIHMNSVMIPVILEVTVNADDIDHDGVWGDGDWVPLRPQVLNPSVQIKVPATILEDIAETEQTLDPVRGTTEQWVDLSSRPTLRVTASLDAPRVRASWQRQESFDTKETIGEFAGIPVIYVPSHPNEASQRDYPTRIEVGKRFFDLPSETQTAVLWHEVGHIVSDEMLKDSELWDVATDALASGFGHLNGQTTPGEVFAEAYSVLHTEPGWLAEHYPTLIDPVLEYAGRMGLPIPTVARTASTESRPYTYYVMRHQLIDEGERKPRHRIETYAAGTKIGELEWYGTTGTIHHIWVEEDYTRQGIATAMWEWGQEMRPRPKHSGDRTDMGDAWARSVGGTLPRRKAAISPEDAEMLGRVTASVPTTLYHLTSTRDFRLKPNYRPSINTTLGGEMPPGIFLTRDVGHWAQGYGYWQPWVVEFDVPSNLADLSGVITEGYGSEIYVPAEHYSRLRIKRVLPLDAYCREEYGGYGWTEEETTFDTNEPVPSDAWRGSPLRGYRYPGDARQEDAEWAKQYAQRVRKYRRSHPGIIASKTAVVTQAGAPVKIDTIERDSEYSRVSGSVISGIGYRSIGSWGELDSAIKAGRWRSDGTFVTDREGRTQFTFDLEEALSLSTSRKYQGVAVLEVDLTGLPFHGAYMLDETGETVMVGRGDRPVISTTNGKTGWLYPTVGLGIGIDFEIPVSNIKQVYVVKNNRIIERFAWDQWTSRRDRIMQEMPGRQDVELRNNVHTWRHRWAWSRKNQKDPDYPTRKLPPLIHLVDRGVSTDTADCNRNIEVNNLIEDKKTHNQLFNVGQIEEQFGPRKMCEKCRRIAFERPLTFTAGKAARGVPCAIPEGLGKDAAMALVRRFANGTATAADVLLCVTDNGRNGAGVQWGLEGSDYGEDWADSGAEEYAWVDEDTIVKTWVEDCVDGGWDASDDEIWNELEDNLGEISVILVGQTDAGYVNGIWDASIGEGQTIHLTEVRYDAGWGWKRLPVSGLTVKSVLAFGKDPYDHKYEGPGAYSADFAKRFWDKVDVGETWEDWPWMGAKSKRGYGRVRVPGGKPEVQWAHRVAYELFFGPQPDDLLIDHVAAFSCQRKDCVNPHHLQAVPLRENTRRAYDPDSYFDWQEEGIDAWAAKTSAARPGWITAKAASMKTTAVSTLEDYSYMLGHKGEKIYRGIKLLDDEIMRQVYDLQRSPMEESEIGRCYEAGPLILDALARPRSGPAAWMYANHALGQHWTLSRDFAETAAVQGAYGNGLPIVLVAECPGDEWVEQDPKIMYVGPAGRMEQEVSLKPGAPIKILDVLIDGALYPERGMSGWGSVLKQPMMKKAKAALSISIKDNYVVLDIEGSQAAELEFHQVQDPEYGPLIYIRNVYVEPEHRGRGFASGLVRELERRWPEAKIVHTNFATPAGESFGYSYRDNPRHFYETPDGDIVGYGA